MSHLIKSFLNDPLDPWIIALAVLVVVGLVVLVRVVRGRR